MNADLPTSQVSSFIYERFDPRHHDLFMRTWGGYIAKGDAKPLREDQLRLLYEANPAGSSVVSVIEEGSVWIGAISAIVTNIRRPGGGIVKGYQIGDFMVDPKFQGRGIGGKLLRDLTRFLLEMRVATYTFPNSRSVGVFLKQSYAELRRVPVIVYPLLPSAGIDRMRSGSRLREMEIDDACRFADGLIHVPRECGAIEKSGAYLLWRYGRMRDARDYTFTSVEPKAGGGRSLLIWTMFRYKGIPAQVVVDAIGEGDTGPALREIAAGGMRRGGWFGVSNVEQRRGWNLPPLAVRIPMRRDPRPARLLIPPEDPVSQEIFSGCLFTTGDWMGF